MSACKKDKPEFEGCAAVSMQTDVLSDTKLETYYYDEHKKLKRVRFSNGEISISYNQNSIETRLSTNIVFTSKLDNRGRIISDESNTGALYTYEYSPDSYLVKEVMNDGKNYQILNYTWINGNMIEKNRNYGYAVGVPEQVMYSNKAYQQLPNGLVYNLLEVVNPYLLDYYGKMPANLPTEIKYGDFPGNHPYEFQMDDQGRIVSAENGGYSFALNYECH